MLKCIACESENISIAERFLTEEFLKRFAYEFNINKTELDSLVNTIEASYEIIRCNSCGLEYANPMIGGGADFYNIIYKYMARTGLRWEFAEFIKDFSAPSKILDIGCGDGRFVRYTTDLGFKSKGIDFNPSRLEMAKNSEAPVENINIDDIARYLASNKDYDIYTLWHVLEHVENPHETLTILSDNSKVNSNLAISIPSDRFYAAHRSPMPILNYPPHHLTRWTVPALETIGKKSGWILERYQYEPIAGAMGIYGTRLAKSLYYKRNVLEELSLLLTKHRFSSDALSVRNDHYLNNIIIKILSRLLTKLLLLEKNRFSGMSLYVKFKKK